MSEELLELCGQIAGLRLPRWGELPDLELYMDQVLSLMQRYLGKYPGFDGKGLTASMVNNYVKLGVMPPAVKKKYTRIHLAYLLMICVLKTVLPMEQVRGLLAASREDREVQTVYDDFCDSFEAAARQAAEAARSEPTMAGLHRAVLLAQAERALAIKWLGSQKRGRE